MSKTINPRLLLSLATLLAAGAVIIGATFAFFSDTETSTGNTLVAGAIDLKIDNTSYYNGLANSGTSWTLDDLNDQLFFDFADVKPSDFGEDTISLHAQNDYWACANITLTANDDNTCTEPETLDDLTCNDPDADVTDGELAQNINFAFWADDGDNVYEIGEEIIDEGAASTVLDNNSIILADKNTNNLGGVDGQPAQGGLDGNNEEIINYIGKAWCFGGMTNAPLPQGDYSGPDDPENDSLDIAGSATPEDGGFVCDGSSLDNATQTDKVLADIQFTAVQSRNNPDFTCDAPTPSVSPTVTLTPTPTPAIACAPTDAIFATSANPSDNDQGLRKNSTAVLPDRSVLSHMFGAPQTAGNPSDTVVPNSFFALGFPLGGNSASVVLGFAEPFYNGPTSEDLLVYEVTGGTYPDERVKIEASKDGITWTVLTASAVRDEAVDLGPLDFANFVRLTDVSNIGLFEATADGYDVDAVKAFCTNANNVQ